MKLEQSFTVAAPVEQVWDMLVDVERVAPCLPGAEITGQRPDGSYEGNFTVKLGPTTASYRGSLKMDSLDEASRTATMHANGTDKRGQGGAHAVIVSTLRQEGEETVVDVSTDFTITGRLARFGRGGMIEDISKRMMRDFSQCLQATITSEPAAAEAPAAAAAGARRDRARDARRGGRRRCGLRRRRRRRGLCGVVGPCRAGAAGAAQAAAAGRQAGARHPPRALRAVGARQALLRPTRRPRREVSEARSWSGADYDRLSTPMEAMGREVLERLPLTGGETVIDAGCGSGRVTEALLARLPDGRVIGVDQSASMIDAARERLGDRAELHVADLSTFDLGLQADAILSTATFHWIADHDALFARLRAHLRPGGLLVAQCGGRGNIARVHAAAREVMAIEPYAPSFEGWRGPWNFAAPAETEERLRAAGFQQARAWLQERPVTPDDPHAYLTEINLGAHLERLPEQLRPRFVDEVVERLGGAPVTIDYVRLNIDATA